MDITRIKEKTGSWLGKYKYLILILVVGIGIMLIPTGTAKQSGVQNPADQGGNTISLAEQLQQILPNIKGAGKVQVLLTLEAGEKVMYQTDTPADGRLDTVIITQADRSQNGLVEQILYPNYRGAIILCQGADSPSVCLAITEAVSKVTGLDCSQISVLKMK